jgi:hypothetical protein
MKLNTVKHINNSIRLFIITSQRGCVLKNLMLVHVMYPAITGSSAKVGSK